MDRFRVILLIVVAVAVSAYWSFDHWARGQTEARISALSRIANENTERLSVIEQEIKRLSESSRRESVGAASEDGVNRREVLKLSGNITELRRRTSELEESRTTTNRPPPQLIYADSTPRSEYKAAGYDSPRAAVESKLWAIRQLDPKAYLESLAPGPDLEMFQKQFSELPEGVMPGGFKNGSMYQATGFRVMEDLAVSDEERHIKLFLEGENITLTAIVKKFGSEWKWSGQTYH